MKSIIDGGEPLYGRFTSIIDLKPFNYLEVAKYFKDKSDEEKFMIYAIFGGVPHYLNLIDRNKSVEENIIRLFYSKNAVMESEIEILLNGELSKIELANTVLSIIKKGSKTYTDINQKISSKQNGNGATYILNKLYNIGLIDKEISINKSDSKKSLYYICDNALLFYYTYIMPYKNQMRLLSPETFYHKYVKKDVETNYIPKQFEKLCKEYLVEMNKRNMLKVPFYAIGKLTYHNKKDDINREFDIVTEDDNGYIYYECKYHQKKMSHKEIEEEIAQASSTTIKFYKYAFFSRKGYEKDASKKEYMLYTLKDIYSID